MNNLKVKQVNSEYILFENGTKILSEHDQDCCESHFLDFSYLEIEEFEDLEFDLSSDAFFKRIEGYGIELLPKTGSSIKIPGYGYNNGYYTSSLELVIKSKKGDIKVYDITECQEIED